jgi:hypothetical protein
MRIYRAVQIASVGAVLVTSGAVAESAGAASSFQEQANSACAAAGAKVEHLSRTVTVTVIDQQISIASSLVRNLRRITPPPVDATAYKKFINETNTQIVDIRAALAAARKNEKARTTSELKKVQAAGAAGNATARGLKLPACAKNYSG